MISNIVQIVGRNLQRAYDRLRRILFLKGVVNMQKPYNPQDDYDDDNIPEIDLPQKTDMIPELPDDRPRRDGPGGE